MLVPISTPVASYAAISESIQQHLAVHVGTWETEYEYADGHNKEVWVYSWNEKEIFLEFQAWAYVNDELKFFGCGFLLHDPNSANYRMYLMMDNGVLHESVGRRVDSKTFQYRMKTHGPTSFQDMDIDVSILDSQMKVTYRWKSSDGKESQSEQLFHKTG